MSPSKETLGERLRKRRLQALGLGWGIKPGEDGDVRSIQMAGTIDAHGQVRLLGGVPKMPAVFLVDGDRVLIEPGGWTEGKWVLVKHPDGARRMHRCEERHGLRFLVGAEAVLYDESVHLIEGVATDRVERL